MSILIKGMDMPSRIDLDFHDNHIVLGGVLYPIDIDQLVYIPTPHGRLVDIDKVKDNLRDQIPCCGLDMTYSNSNAFDTMDNAPTILEAEE